MFLRAWCSQLRHGRSLGLRVAAGLSTVIDYAVQMANQTYQWTSMDLTWLAYLSDVTAATPRFHAPAEAETPYHIGYRRLVMDAEGAVADRELISITVHWPGGSVVSDGRER